MESTFSGSDVQETAIDFIAEDSETVVPIDVHVKNLNYTITDKPGSWWQKLTHLQMPWEWMEKGRINHVLQDISFTAKSGQLMAIMGGSGSGKTSLLDVISCRTSAGTITGEVYLNKFLRTRSHDRLIGSLTVRETLMFVAQLKLPRTFTSVIIKKRVENVISELGLKHRADTKVGDAALRGLSGGERRRVSIGIQLLILPSILFLDEPTSGLDSFTASNLVQTLSRLVVKKRTIIMSIHQPRFDIFNMVDTLMILSRGRIVYNGPGKDIVGYFTTLGFPCPEHTNPCDFYIDLATVDTTSKDREESSLAIVTALHEAYRVTAEAMQVFEKTNTGGASQDIKARAPAPLTKTNKMTSSWSVEHAVEEHRLGPTLMTQFYILFMRFVRIKADNYVVLLTHMIQALMMSLLLGLVYIDLKYDDQSIRDWFSIMFMSSVMYPFMVILGLIGTCHEERHFLYFELQDRLYSPAAYYFARVSSDLPFHLVYVLLYCLPMYGMAGLTVSPYACGMFYLFVSVSVFTSRSLAMMSAVIMPTYQISSMLAQIIFSLFIMGAGFFINLNSMIYETRWISKASYLRWSYQALCIIGINDLEFHCSTYNCTNLTISGKDTLKTYALDGVELWECALGLAISMFFFLSVMFVGLKFIPQKPHND
ncbi:unnamed protein product [Candidula unifasciata]|uniref:ABC transporter domain-containing protein n=1 Tax=Candidula unifasciata TaxID=100452 RepID=A0A8S3ZJL9_9EUPU|nr:unnamed protein product [Candidula unifasciata]